MINPAYDVWVWGAGVLFLLLMGARAYVVETGQVRLGGTPTFARVLTVAIFLVLVALGGLLAMQGGIVLYTSIAHHTDPSEIPNLVLEPTPAPAVPGARRPRARTGRPARRELTVHPDGSQAGVTGNALRFSMGRLTARVLSVVTHTLTWRPRRRGRP